MVMHNLSDLLIHELNDLYDGERQLTKALARMARAATSTELQQAIQSHLRETEGQVRRLERVFELLGSKPGGGISDAMHGLIEEGAALFENESPGEVKDAGLIAAVRRIEHYEIASYGAARSFAAQLGLGEAARLLQESLDEESAADRTLTRIAAESVNAAAMNVGQSHLD